MSASNVTVFYFVFTGVLPPFADNEARKLEIIGLANYTHHGDSIWGLFAVTASHEGRPAGRGAPRRSRHGQDMCRGRRLLGLLVALSLFAPAARADEHNHVYEDGDEVVLWMSTIGPYHNRQETYSYYSLPFCRGTKLVISHYLETLAEALQGIELTFSGLDIKFKEDISKAEYCQISLNKEKQKVFAHAIKNQYWYQMYIDDLPIWGIVGEIENNDGVVVSDSYYIWTHKKFDIGYNGKQIVDVSLTSDNRVKLVQGAHIPFSYEINWKKSNIKYEDRFDKYLDSNFF